MYRKGDGGGACKFQAPEMTSGEGAVVGVDFRMQFKETKCQY